MSQVKDRYSQKIRQNKADKRKQAKAKKREEAKTKAQLLFQGQDHPKKQRKIVRIEQWAEIRIDKAGTVTTTLYPSNADLIKRGQKMWPPPEFVYRRLNFPNGIPHEYDWVGVIDGRHRKLGGCGIQRMTTDTWLDVIEREAKREDGHIGPTGVGNLPRPKETGGCTCPTCTENKAILEAQAAA